MDTERFLLHRQFLAPAVLAFCLGLPSSAVADTAAGTYRGFLAFDFKGKEVREAMMITFHQDGTMIMGAEEGHDEPVDADTGRITRNDVESASLGLWRTVDGGAIEFGTQQYRAGSGFCGPVNAHGKDMLATCSFILTARLEQGLGVRGETCDLGGLGGGFSIQSVDGKTTEANPMGLGLRLDYCLQRMSVDRFLELAPIR